MLVLDLYEDCPSVITGNRVNHKGLSKIHVVRSEETINADLTQGI